MKEATNCVLGILIFVTTSAATILCITVTIHIWKDILKKK